MMHNIPKILELTKNQSKHRSVQGIQSSLDPDTKLMIRVAQGDKGAFEDIYLKYAAMVRAYLLDLGGASVPLDDLVQEVFSRVWQQRQAYLPRSPLKSYLNAFAQRVILEYLRQQRRYHAIRQLAATLKKSPSLDQGLVRLENKNLISQMLQRLSHKQRQSLELVFKLNLLPREAARQADSTPVVFQQQLYEATKRLQELVISQANEDPGRMYHVAD